MNEFDEVENEVPLYERVIKKAGGKGRSKPSHFGFTGSDDDETHVSKTDSSVNITPPPPSSPESRKQVRKDVLATINNALNPKRKFEDTEEGKIIKRKPEIETQVKESSRRAPKEQVVKLSKELKELERMINKQTDKTEVNKYMLVVIDPALVSCPPGSEILNILNNPPSGKPEHIFQFSVEKQKIPCSISWKRKIIHLNIREGGISETWIDERRTLVFMSAEEVAEKITNGLFSTWAESIRFDYGRGHNLTLMVYNYATYFKTDKNAQERMRKAAVRGENINPRGAVNSCLITEYKMQEALLMLSINQTMDYLTFDRATDKGWKECACNVFHQTRAVAEAPEKLKKSVSSSAGFEFYAKADGKDCISPKNLVEYWKQVLMQVTIISLEKASAITRAYPSPSSLIQAYRTCDSRKEAESLLANIEIRRLDTLVGGIRRIGDEISRKVYLALMSDDETSLLSNI